MEFNLTKNELIEVVPTSLRTNITDEFVKEINESIADPFHRKAIRDNVYGYAVVLREGKYKVSDYINAVKYCSFKLAGLDNIDAYRETFPDRWKKFMQEGTDRKTIHSYVSAFNSNAMVKRILEMAMIPVWLNNADVFQEAINTQAELMRTANSEKVRSDAANSLLTHLKRPEVKQGQLEININNQQENDLIAELRKSTQAIVDMQQGAMKQGVTIDQIAEADIKNPMKDVN